MRKSLFSLLLTLLLVMASATGINAQTSNDTLLNENFNSTSGTDLPTDWDTCRWVAGSSVTSSTSASTLASYRWKSNTGGVNSSRCAYLSASQSYTLQHGLMTPARQFSSTEDYKICFDLKNYNSTTATYKDGDMNIYVTLNDGVTILDTIAENINTGVNWTHYEYAIPSSVRGQSNVRILFLGKSYHYYYLDNVMIVKASQCKPATGITLSSITSAGASFYWYVGQALTGNEQNPTQYTVNVYLKSDNSLVSTQNVTTEAVTLNTLTANTEYVLEVLSDCGTAGAGDPATYEFKTLAASASLPYYLDFESGIPSECFTKNVTLVTSGASYIHEGSKSIKLVTTAADDAYFYTQMLNVNANNAEVDLWIKPSASGKQILFGYTTNPYSTDDFVPVMTYTSTGTSWQEIRFNTSSASDQQNPVMIAVSVASGSSFTLYVDSMHVHTIPSCARPENIEVTAKTHNSVTLGWDMSTASSHHIIAVSAGDTAFNQVVSATNSYTVTGLTPNTDYHFAVAASCTGGEESELKQMTDSVRTLCDIASLTTMTEGAESAVANKLPDCWTTGIISAGTGTSGSVYTDYPFNVSTSSTAKHTGSKGFQLRSMKAGTISYLSSQQRDFGTSGQYTVSLWVNRTSTSKLNEGIDLWITPVVGDTAGGTHLGMINRYYAAAPVEAASGWYKYEYVINYSGNGYLTFIGKSQYGAVTNFDDIEIFETPTCAHVTDLAAGSVSGTSIDLNWTAGGSETQWQVGYKVTSGGVNVVADTLIVSSASYTITGLQPSSSYVLNAFVRSVCGNDTAPAEAITNHSFTTACAALTSIPYTMGFEENETFLDYSTTYYYPLCWSRYNDYTGSSDLYKHYPYVSTSSSYAHTGSRGVYAAVSSSYAANSIVILPDVDTTLYDINNLRVKFWAKESGTTYSINLYLGVMTDITDFSTFTVVDTVLVTGNTWTLYTMDLSRYTGNGTHIGINFSKAGLVSSSAYTYLDDLTLDEIPSCADLQGSATVSDLSSSSCKITIDDQTAASSWQYAYGATGTPVASMTPVDVTTDTVTISGLTPATGYDLYVRRNCGAGDFGAWSDPVSLLTPAIPATMPYICGFEDNTENANWLTTTKASQYYGFTIGTDTNGVYDGVKAMYVTNSTGAYTYTAAATSNAGRAFAYRSMHFDAKGYQIDLKWKSTGGESYYDFGRILLTSTSTPLNLTNQSAQTALNFNAVAEVDTGIYYTSGTNVYRALNCSTYNSCSPDANGWCTISYYLDMTNHPGDYNLVLMWNQDASGGNATYPLAVDQISITELNCIPASTVIATPATTSATLTIQQNSVLGWEVIVDDEPINTDSISEASQYLYRQQTSTNTVNLTDLTANTRYYYTLRTLCAGSNISDWREVEYFNTNCAAFTTPYNEDFESLVSVNCWSNLSNDPAVNTLARSTEQHKGGSASMKSVGALAVTPELNVDSLTNYQLTGWIYSALDTVILNVQVTPDLDDNSDPIATDTIISKNQWHEFTVYFDTLSSSAFSDYKNSRYVILNCGNATVYFDDIEVKLAPACRKPNAISVSNVGANQFDISFNDNSGASQWIVRCNDGAADILDTISTTSATITGLVGHTDYTVSVAALCSAAPSDFSEYGTITTACDGFELPWTCGFEASEGWSNTSYVAGDAESKCFNTLYLKADGKSYPYFYSYNSSTYAHSGSKCLYAYNYSSTSSAGAGFFILPPFDAATNNLNVEYYARNSSTTSTYPDIEFGYMTDINDSSSFVLLQTWPKTTTMTKRTHQMSSYSGVPANARLAFRIQKKTGGYYIDDIEVSEVHSCSDPNAATVSNVTASSATFHITDTCQSHTAWEYLCIPSDASTKGLTPTAVPANDTVVVTGLLDNTAYKFLVRAICGVGDVSAWVKTDFTTECVPFTVTEANPFVEDFDSYAYGLILDGNSCYSIPVQGTSDSYKFKVYPTSTPSTTSSYTYFYSHSASATGKCLYLYGSNSYTPNGAKIMRDFIFQAGKTYEISAYVRAGTSTSYTSRFDMLLSDGSSVDTLQTKIMQGASVSSISYEGKTVYRYDLQYEQMRVFFTAPSTGTYDLGFKVSNGSTTGGAYYYLYLDDWTVTEYNGCMPHSATLDSVSGANAYFTIDDTVAGHTWEYVLGDTVTGTPAATSNRSIVVSGLAPSTSYTLYIRTYCSASNYSEWMAVPFVSACDAISSYPYTQDFENEFLPNCWSQFYTNNGTATTANYWTQYTSATATYIQSGTHAANLPYKANTNTALVTGAFDMSTNPYGYTVSFWMYRVYTTSTTDYSSDILHLLVSDQPITAQNVASATEIAAIHKVTKYDPVESATASGRYQYEYDVPSQFLGGDAYFALYHTVNSGYSTGIYVDDFVITEIPSCRTPKSAPTVAGTTKHTATVSFDMAGKDSIRFGWAPYANGVAYTDITDSLTSVTESVTISGLDSATTYALFARYLCGGAERSAWSPYATFTTRATDCFDPENIHTVGLVDNANATIAWTSIADATGYEYILSHNSIVDSTNVVTANSVTFNSLAALTAYTFSLRGICPDDTTDWVTFSFNTTAVPMTMPYITDFDNSSRDSEWTILTPSTVAPNRFVIGSGASVSGSRSLYVSNDNSANNYQIAADGGVAATSFSYAQVLLPFTAGDYMVSYDWRCYGEGFTGTSAYDFGRIFLVPAGTTIPTLTYSQLYGTLSTIPGVISVSNNILNNTPSWTTSADIINVPEDKLYNLVIAWVNDASGGNQPPFAIDNITVQPASCLPVADITPVSISDSKAVFSVTRRAGNAGTTLHYAVSQYPSADSIHSYTTFVPASATSMTDTFTVRGLDAQSQYYFYVRSVCDSASVSPWLHLPFRTTAAPKTMPFVCSFDNDADTASWLFANSQYSWFIIGTGTSNSGAKSLYITDDGSAYHYTSPGTPTTANGTSYAYIPLSFGPSTYEVDFDWNAMGVSTVDYGRAFLAPTDAELTADVLYSGLTYSATPTGWIALDGTKLNLASDWQHRYTSVTFTDSVVMNLVFVWRQNYTTDTQGPLAIDNIEIREQTCAPVTGVTYSASTTTATLKARHSNQNAQIFWHLSTNNAYTDTVAMAVTDSVFTATNLTPGSRYYIRAAVICNGNDTAHANSYYFRTACDTVRQFPYFEGFEDMTAGVADTVWYKDNCWNMAKTSTSAYSYPHTSYAHSGNQGLYVYNSSTSGTQQILTMPMMQNLNGKTVSFWHKAYSTTSTYAALTFGYVVGSNFTAINTFDHSTSWREFTQTLSNIPNGARLAFKFDGTYYYYLDDIRINDIVTAPAAYNDTICFNAPYNNHGLSFSAGALFTGDTTITTLVQSTTPGVADSIITVNINVRQEIATIAYDTICANTPSYIWGNDTILNPTGTATHTQTFIASCGCDSTVALTLTVLPESVTINQTICQGDSFLLGDTILKHAGTYLLSYQTAQGCTISANVNLTVVDSLQITTAAICAGSTYTFEGGTYSQPGTYRVATVGAAGCDIIKELHLTVYPTDSTIVTSFCRGGSIIVAGEVITNDTVFDKTLVNPGVDCTTTYHVTATTDAPVPAMVYDNVCEGRPYSGYGINNLTVTQDTVINVTSRTADGLCDSVTTVNLTYVPTSYGYESVEMPATGSYDWHDRSLTQPGDYVDTISSSLGCDSICTLHLYESGSAVENVNEVIVNIVPNPVHAGETAYVTGDFTSDVTAVEILNSYGQVVDRFVPQTYPIEVQGINAAGLYYVRITTSAGQVHLQKLIVK